MKEFHLNSVGAWPPWEWSRSAHDHDMLVCLGTLPEPAVGAVWGHGKQCPGEVFVQSLWLWINPEVIVVGCILVHFVRLKNVLFVFPTTKFNIHFF